MRRTKRGGKRRPEIGETLVRTEKGLRDGLRTEGMIVGDLDTVIETLSKLNFEGTFEGSEAVNASIEDARDVTVDTFHEEDRDMGVKHGERDAYRGELDDHAAKDESDLGSVSDAVSRVDTRETLAKLNDTKNRVLEDLKFLRDTTESAAAKSSEIAGIQDDYRRQVMAKGGRK